MIAVPLKSLFNKYMFLHKNPSYFRYIRSIAGRESGAKLIKGKVTTVDDPEELPRIHSYKDFIQNIKESNLSDELDVEKQFVDEDYHGDAFENCEMYYDMHLSEEKRNKSLVKKKIVSHKYFKADKETNLLTHAAKEQIRFLHNLNPQEWHCKSLSECFPISENGVKKLLRSNFVQTCPEKIKLHDQEVAKKWEILKSGKFTNAIAPLTQKLYKEGKLVDDYFSGNPNLPTVSPPFKKIIVVKKKEEIGEFCKIVQSYCNYEKQNLIESGKENSSEKQISVLNANNSIMPEKKVIKNLRQYKHASEEFENDNANPEVYPSIRRVYADEGDIPFSEFKEVLKEETRSKLKSKYKNEYDDFVMQETSKKENNTPDKLQYIQNCFIKIPKYEKENISLKFERNKSVENVYKYDKKLGYQHPIGKNIKGKVYVPPEQFKKGKFIKVGQCVYDDNGEFLYRTP